MRKELFFAIVVLLFGRLGGEAKAANGPSFDCNPNTRSTLAVILCNSPEAAKADWEVSSAYWALNRDDRGEAEFNRFVIRRCGLPSIETADERNGRVVAEGFGKMFLGPGFSTSATNSISDRHVACVVETFYEKAREIRSKLSGDGLREARSSPEEHIAIQEDLISRGILTDRVKRYGVKADGQFGPNTRMAILEFQRSLGAQETGFLTETQRVVLADTPERVAAKQRSEEMKRQRVAVEDAERVADEARRDKLRQEVIETQKRAEEAKRQEAIKQEADRVAAEALREKARQEAIENRKRAEEQAKRIADEKEKLRLEAEAIRATEWRRRIDEAQIKGKEYASANDLQWKLQDHKNPMTDDTEYEVRSSQPNGAGALAEVQGQCLGNQVFFSAVLLNDNDGKIPLGLVTSQTGGLIGRKRLDDSPVFATDFPRDKWSNKIVLANLSFQQEAAEGADTTWRVLAEIETSKGPLYIKIPTFDPKIQKLVAACKVRWETERRKNPGSGR